MIGHVYQCGLRSPLLRRGSVESNAGADDDQHEHFFDYLTSARPSATHSRTPLAADAHTTTTSTTINTNDSAQNGSHERATLTTGSSSAASPSPIAPPSYSTSGIDCSLWTLPLRTTMGSRPCFPSDRPLRTEATLELSSLRAPRNVDSAGMPNAEVTAARCQQTSFSSLLQPPPGMSSQSATQDGPLATGQQGEGMDGARTAKGAQTCALSMGWSITPGGSVGTTASHGISVSVDAGDRSLLSYDEANDGSRRGTFTGRRTAQQPHSVSVHVVQTTLRRTTPTAIAPYSPRNGNGLADEVRALFLSSDDEDCPDKNSHDATPTSVPRRGCRSGDRSHLLLSPTWEPSASRVNDTNVDERCVTLHSAVLSRSPATTTAPGFSPPPGTVDTPHRCEPALVTSSPVAQSSLSRTVDGDGQRATDSPRDLEVPRPGTPHHCEASAPASAIRGPAQAVESERDKASVEVFQTPNARERLPVPAPSHSSWPTRCRPHPSVPPNKILTNDSARHTEGGDRGVCVTSARTHHPISRRDWVAAHLTTARDGLSWLAHTPLSRSTASTNKLCPTCTPTTVPTATDVNTSASLASTASSPLHYGAVSCPVKSTPHWPHSDDAGACGDAVHLLWRTPADDAVHAFTGFPTPVKFSPIPTKVYAPGVHSPSSCGSASPRPIQHVAPGGVPGELSERSTGSQLESSLVDVPPFPIDVKDATMRPTSAVTLFGPSSSAGKDDSSVSSPSQDSELAARGLSDTRWTESDRASKADFHGRVTPGDCGDHTLSLLTPIHASLTMTHAYDNVDGLTTMSTAGMPADSPLGAPVAPTATPLHTTAPLRITIPGHTTKLTSVKVPPPRVVPLAHAPRVPPSGPDSSCANSSTVCLISVAGHPSPHAHVATSESASAPPPSRRSTPERQATPYSSLPVRAAVDAACRRRRARGTLSTPVPALLPRGKSLPAEQWSHTPTVGDRWPSSAQPGQPSASLATNLCCSQSATACIDSWL